MNNTRKAKDVVGKI